MKVCYIEMRRVKGACERMEETKKTVAVAYRRVSTDAQGGADRFGLDSQKKQIEDYADANGIDIVKWYDDVGESGAKDNRPALSQILYGDEVVNPPFEMVIVAKADRMARDIYLYYAYKHQLNQKNVQLVSVAEDFGSMGAFAPVLEAFIVAMAQVERETIRTRTLGARRIKSSTGQHAAGRAIYGYDIKEKRRVINEKEAAVVKEIFWQLSMGSKFIEVATWLNEKGYTTKMGGNWERTNISNMVEKAPVYRGMTKNMLTGEWIPGDHEPILTEEELAAAEEGMAQNPYLNERGKRGKKPRPKK